MISPIGWGDDRCSLGVLASVLRARTSVPAPIPDLRTTAAMSSMSNDRATLARRNGGRGRHGERGSIKAKGITALCAHHACKFTTPPRATIGIRRSRRRAWARRATRSFAELREVASEECPTGITLLGVKPAIYRIQSLQLTRASCPYFR